MNVATKQVTAIDIGTSSVKVIELEETSSGMRLVNWGIAQYHHDSAGEITDDVIISRLRDVSTRAKMKPKSTVVSIPRSLVTVKKLANLPASDTDEEIENIINLQAEVAIPFGASNSVYTYHNIQRLQDGASAELVAARKSDVERYMNILKAVGIRPGAIVPSAYASGSLALFILSDNNVDSSTIILDVGAGETDLSILQKGRISFSRSLSIGGNHLTQAYARENNLSLQEAEEHKIASANLRDDNPPPALLEWASGLADEIQRSIQAFNRDTVGELQIDDIWLCGGAATLPGLDKFITDSLGISTTLWNPLSILEPNAAVEPPSNLSYGFSVPLGLCVNHFTDRIPVNLLPREELERKSKAKQKMFALSYAAVALIFLVGVVWGGTSWVNSRNTRLRNINEQLRETEKDAKRAQVLLTDDLIMADMLSPKVSPLDVLLELTKQNPDRKKVAFLGFTLDRTKVKIDMKASSDAEASNVVSLLSKSELFSDVKAGQFNTVEKNKKTFVQFQITCKLADRAANVIIAQKEKKKSPEKLAHKPSEKKPEPSVKGLEAAKKEMEEKVAAQQEKPEKTDEDSPKSSDGKVGVSEGKGDKSLVEKVGDSEGKGDKSLGGKVGVSEGKGDKPSEAKSEKKKVELDAKKKEALKKAIKERMEAKSTD